jgi:putative sterol carrier protein
MPTPIDIRKFFNSDMPAALTTHAAAARAINARYQLSITGSTGGEWTLDLTPKGPSCTPGKNGTTDCTITCSDADFRTLCAKPEANAVSLFMSGKIKVSGNQALAMKLGKIVALVPLPKA